MFDQGAADISARSPAGSPGNSKYRVCERLFLLSNFVHGKIREERLGHGVDGVTYEKIVSG